MWTFYEQISDGGLWTSSKLLQVVLTFSQHCEPNKCLCMLMILAFYSAVLSDQI
jgi:hypothetical protein